jgi:hypothetical protein
MGARVTGIVAAALLFAGAATAAIPHRADVTKLYARDHGGRAPKSEAELAPYSKEYEKLLASCMIQPADLTGATTSMAGQVASAGGRSFSSLQMLRAFTRRITWTARRDCWNTFFDVESAMSRRGSSRPPARARCSSGMRRTVSSATL